MIICVCHRISDRDIARMVRAGCASFDELQFESAVATCCGKCHDSARKAFDTHRSPAVGGPAAERADAAGLRRQRVIPIARPLRHDRTAWSAA